MSTYTVVAYYGKIGKKTAWECVCDCGGVKTALTSNITRGKTRSCGCICIARTKEANTKHGHAANYKATPEYKTWLHMWGRCTNPNDKRYSRYGGRGITVCDRWKSFENFLLDMGHKPYPGLTLDRFPDQKGSYERANCRWATWEQQNNNKEGNKLVLAFGIALTVPQWAKRIGVKSSKVRSRLLRESDPETALRSCAPSVAPVINSGHSTASPG